MRSPSPLKTFGKGKNETSQQTLTRMYASVQAIWFTMLTICVGVAPLRAWQPRLPWTLFPYRSSHSLASSDSLAFSQALALQLRFKRPCRLKSSVIDQEHESCQQTLEDGTHTWEQVIKKSRFIGIAKNCSSWKEAQEFLCNVRAEHPKSRHVCYGMIAGHNPSTERSGDDGEPTGTGGAPILNAIRGANLSDTLCVVVRYYGGVKLGAGGLIRAYGGTAREALRSAPSKVLIPQSTISLECSVVHTGSIYDISSKFGGNTEGEEYLEEGTLRLSIICNSSDEANLIAQLNDATQGGIKWNDS